MKSQKFAEYYMRVAKEAGAAFFDVGSVVTTSDLDGVHWSAESHRLFAEALLPIVANLLEEGNKVYG